MVNDHKNINEVATKDDDILFNNNLDYDQYHLAKMSVRIIARLLDIIFSSIIPLIFTFTLNYWFGKVYYESILLIAITFVDLVGYFILIPYYCAGKTLWKWILQIKLVSFQNKIKFWNLCLREFIIIFFPWLVALIVNLINYFVFGANLKYLFDKSYNGSSIATLISRLAVTFYFLWFVCLSVITGIDKKHQFFIDIKFEIYVVKKNIKVKENQFEHDKLISRKTDHIHLQKDQPGNIDNEILKEIEDL